MSNANVKDSLKEILKNIDHLIFEIRNQNLEFFSDLYKMINENVQKIFEHILENNQRFHYYQMRSDIILTEFDSYLKNLENSKKRLNTEREKNKEMKKNYDFYRSEGILKNKMIDDLRKEILFMIDSL